MKPIKFKERRTLLGRLKELRRVLSKVEHWTKGSYATYAGNASHLGLYNAAKQGKVCSVCLEGGTMLVDKGYWGPTYQAIRDEVQRAGLGYSIPTFNDRGSTTHTDVLSIIANTIEWAKARGGGRKIIHD